MPQEEPKEEIEIRLDGVKVKSIEDIPPALRPDVEKRINEARISLAPKYAPGKLRMRINVNTPAYAAARKAKKNAPPAAASIDVDEEKGRSPALIAAVAIAALAGAYFFVPGFQDAAAKAADAITHLRKPAAAPAAPLPPAPATAP